MIWGRSLFRTLFPFVRPRLRGLALERHYLIRNIKRTDERMQKLAHDFWACGGVCCPSCGISGYSELCDKQQRRMERLGQIDRKLARPVKRTSALEWA